MVFAKMANPLICFAITLWILYIGKDVLITLSFACLLAILLTSPCRALEKIGLSRAVASILCLILALVLFVIIFYFISTSIVSFKNDFPAMLKNIEDLLKGLQDWIKTKFHLTTQKAKELVSSSTSNVIPETSSIVNSAISTVSDTFFTGVVLFLQTFLLLLYRSLIIKFFITLFADQFSNRIYYIFDRTRYVIRSYIVGLFIEMAVVAAAYCGALFILGVKYALLLGVIGAILNIIPYLGIFIACILTALITYTTNSGVTVLWSVIAIVIIHLVDSNILLPKIVGSKVKINAMATIMGVIIGSAIWGIPGMFLAVPIMAILKVVFEDIPALHSFAILMGDDATEKLKLTPVAPIIVQVKPAEGDITND